jgi:hypothetical protein
MDPCAALVWPVAAGNHKAQPSVLRKPKARRLIEKHGYWRRKEELEDAEAAARALF